MIHTLQAILWFTGLVYGSNRLLKINLPQAPLFSISFAATILFFSSMFGLLEAGTQILMGLGYLLFLPTLIELVRSPAQASPFLKSPLIWGLAGLIAFSYILTIGMTFTVDDDYVFWGIIGKYLYQFNHLPDTDTTIMRRHLAYTPGTSLMHYFFYQFSGQYSAATSYFAQSFFLISALFAIVSKKLLKQSMLLFATLVILMTLFSGSVFTKLQVDYLLSIYFFILLWIIYHENPSPVTALVVSLPLCTLFLIKEIGFGMGWLLIIIFFTKLLFDKNSTVQEKVKTSLCLCLVGALFISIKAFWTNHCQAMGFSNFSGGVNRESIKASLSFFSNPDALNGLILFIKAFFFESADRLNLPYIFWYCLIGFLVVNGYKKSDPKNQGDYLRLAGLFSVFLFIYLILLYFMQVIVFQVGTSSDHIIGFERYFNILFTPVAFFYILLCIQQWITNKNIATKTWASVLILIVLVLGGSRLETTLHREKQFITAEQIASQIEPFIQDNPNSRIAVIPGTDKDYLWIRLLYHLLPARIHHGPFPATDKTSFLNNLKHYDYLVFYQMNDSILKWISPLLDKPFNKTGFYKIDLTSHNISDSETVKLILLKDIQTKIE